MGEALMDEKINAGAILIKDGTVLPEHLQLETGPYSKGWRLVKHLDAKGLDRKIREAGWTLFFMANEVNGSSVGCDLEKAKRRAVKNAFAYMKSDGLNCLEIAQVGVKRFLGLCYVSVCAQPRHVQEGIFLFHAKYVTESDRAQLAAA
jgi:hypothetical protein